MPTYDFECPAGHETERFYRKIGDAPSEVECPECGRPALRRVSGGAGLIFKGSGFYITDYGKDGKKQQKPAAPSGEGKPDSASEGASGAKSPSEKATSAPEAKSPERKSTGRAEKGSKPARGSDSSE